MQLQVRRTTKKKNTRDRTRVLDAHLHLAKNDFLIELVPRVILLSNGSQQNQCLVQQVQERDSWLTRGRNTDATAPMILSSRPSATLEVINRPDSAACEITGRFMMRLVTSCITGRHPRAPAGATLLRATVEAARQSVLTEC